VRNTWIQMDVRNLKDVIYLLVIKKQLFPLSSPLGLLYFKKWTHESVLMPYGIGITLYFKYLVSLILI
jgi:hypothetical protein